MNTNKDTYTSIPIKNETFQTFLKNLSEQDKILVSRSIYDFSFYTFKEVLETIIIKHEYNRRLDYYTLNLSLKEFKNYLENKMTYKCNLFHLFKCPPFNGSEEN